MATYKPGRYTRTANKPAPKAPGAYRHVSKRTGEVVRQGETEDLDRRLKEHDRSNAVFTSGHYDVQWKAADGRSTSKTRREHEQRKIREKRPKFNERDGGGGRKAQGGSGRRKGD